MHALLNKMSGLQAESAVSTVPQSIEPVEDQAASTPAPIPIDDEKMKRTTRVSNFPATYQIGDVLDYFLKLNYNVSNMDWSESWDTFNGSAMVTFSTESECLKFVQEEGHWRASGTGHIRTKASRKEFPPAPQW